MLGYDVGLLSREEADILRGGNVLPNHWQGTAETAPFTVFETEHGDTIGFLRFPSLPPGEDIPTAQLIKSLSDRIEEERQKVELLIALSDWGWVGEREYLAQDPDFVPDFLLGSGHGSGVNGRILAQKRCVWVRAYDRGRSIVEIRIYEWPDRKNSFAWEASKNYKTTSVGLNDSITDNPEVDALFR